ncbi:glycosyltransferase [Cereibacter sp. SYSU M97828]|nr:glycosyltransferase [Cereibacter flavus]
MKNSKFSSGKIKGWIGFYSNKNIRGWVMNSAATEQRYDIQVSVGDVKSTIIAANEYREHLEQKGLGDGKYGFSFTLPASSKILSSETPVTITAIPSGEVLARKTLYELVGYEGPAPSQAANGSYIPAAEIVAEDRTFTGWVGAFASRRISGWLSDNGDTQKSQTVIVEVGDHRSPPILASEHRDHLTERDFGSTNLGFTYVIPEHVNVARGEGVRVLTEIGTSTGVSALIESGYDKFVDMKISRSTSSKFPRRKQEDSVLLWCPIAVCGLTTQLEQVTAILKAEKVKYHISYHVAPKIEHPELEHWIEPRDIDSPKMVLYFERFVAFDRGFEGSFKVFYVNLDWLSDTFLGLARTNADVILAPVSYRKELLEETFPSQKVIYLPWPSAIEPQVEGIKSTSVDHHAGKINVLYIGNDYSLNSRKSPEAVVEAITSYAGDNLIFDLKFRSTLPPEVKDKLVSCKSVRTIIDYPVESEVIAELHSLADVSIIPNECEGNGLSILEAWAFEVLPAVLDGHPMRDVADEMSALFIGCEQYGWKEKTPVYRTSSADILALFERLDHKTLSEMRPGLIARKNELKARKIVMRNVLRGLVHASGIRNKSQRLRIEAAHEVDQKSGSAGAYQLMFGSQQHRDLLPQAKSVDVIMTTSRRPDHLARSLPALVQAIERSPYKHRLFLAVDGLDEDTATIMREYKDALDVVLFTKDRSGLPFTWNSIRDLHDNYVSRHESPADYLCYIQDDCLILEPDRYFSTMVDTAERASPSILGLVSGFHTEVHPGFAVGTLDDRTIIYSDSIDGKNFMGRPRTFKSITPLTWWFSDGMRRGNPGPVRGSHFDLWLWKESPNSLSVQKRINIILPDLTTHIANDAHSSTWNNDTSDANVQSRINEGRVYATRAG